MAQLNRRSFLKFLSVSPAIFHASLGFGKVSNELPKELLSEPEILQTITEPTPVIPSGNHGMVIIHYPGKPTMTGGEISYNAETNQTRHIFKQSGTLK